MTQSEAPPPLMEASGPLLEALPRDYLPGHVVPPHCHDQVQLLYGAEGVMRVSTPEGVWILPPLRALLVPAGVPHSLVMLSPLRLRTVLIDTALVDATLAAPLGRNCELLEVSPLLRELLLSLTTWQAESGASGPVERNASLSGDATAVRGLVPTKTPAGRGPKAKHATATMTGTTPRPERALHLSALILDELAAAPLVPLQIPWPTDRRLIAVCEAILASPGQLRPLEDWAEVAGASARTLIRLFPKETGLAYRRWVQQVHLAEALSRLAHGEPVARIAAALGYASPSAFSAMFRRLLGVPPQRYLQSRSGQ